VGAAHEGVGAAVVRDAEDDWPQLCSLLQLRQRAQQCEVDLLQQLPPQRLVALAGSGDTRQGRPELPYDALAAVHDDDSPVRHRSSYSHRRLLWGLYERPGPDGPAAACHHRRRSFVKRPAVPFVACLLAVACATLAVSWTFAAEGSPATRHVDAVVLLAGEEAGSYSEETAGGPKQIRDTVAQDLILNRLGAQVEIRSRDVEVQDSSGRLTSGHYESTTSKTTVTTDLAVKGQTLELTTASGGKSYTRELPFTGELLGPAGVRALLAHAQTDHPLHFQTFVSELGAVGQVTLVLQGHEMLKAGTESLDTLKLEERVEGFPLVVTLWTDTQGYTVRALEDSPFGTIEIRRGKPASAGRGVELPADVYVNTLAVSNIRLPDPRHLQQVTLEISAKDAAGIEWPRLGGGTQRVISATPHALVLEVSQSVPAARRDGDGPPSQEYLAPNALLQSDDAEVRRIAAGAAAGERDPWKIVLALQQWVNAHMHFDMGIAMAPAAEVARDRHGTCVGYAVLLASLARAQHIPSRLVMGYVYEDRIWGGHAWAEVFIDGQWRAVDAAEYAPGTADAARIAVSRDSGVSTSIEGGSGELVKLFSKINIRTLSYRLGDQTVEVPATAAGHTVTGNTYVNPWLGLTLVKPPEAAFTGMDGHWPGLPALVTVKQADAAVTVLYVDAGPAPEVLRSVLGGADGPFEPLTWQGLPAIRGRAGGQEGLAVTQGGAVWVLRASGPGGHALLESLLPGASLTAVR
jgi:transglutaminase-like putative cysteine protease